MQPRSTAIILMEGRRNVARESAMADKIGASTIVLCGILLVLASRGEAEDAPRLDRNPWPIWHWHNHQPRQDQLGAMHKNDVTPEESREIDRLYMQLEHDNSKILVHRHKVR